MQLGRVVGTRSATEDELDHTASGLTATQDLDGETIAVIDARS